MKKITVLLTAIVFVSIFNGCRKDEFTTSELPEQVSLRQKDEFAFKDGQMILGEKLKNPYSVENMQIAFDNLQAENKLKSEIKIETTHYYVRFRPKSMQELDIITRDTTLNFFDYPLDIEINRGGTHYHDPSIPKNEITWQYTVVPVDYFFPKVQYQKLANLYLPEDGSELRKLKSASIEHFDWLKLETEALKITNNLDNEDTSDNRLKSTSWVPKGTIKVWDDVMTKNYSTAKQVFLYYNYYNGFTEEIITQLEDSIDNHVYAEDILPQLPINISNYIQEIFDERGNPSNHYEQWDILEEIIEDSREAVYTYETNTTNSHFIPLEGVEVRATRWFTAHTGLTDANGNFTCNGTFDRPANYSIKWERYDFDIRDGSYGQAYYNGEKFEGDWNLNIEKSYTPKSFLFAHIFRAAHTYYYKHSQWGIKAPPRRDGIFGFLNQRLHIAGNDEAGRSKYLDIRHLWQSAQISVFSKSPSGIQQDSHDIFGTAIHELAHASHWEIGYSSPQYAIDWIFDSPYLPESWAVGVETILTRNVYGTNTYNYYYQSLTIAAMSDGYTCIVEDMIDSTNQFGTNPLYPNDQVSGYTLSQLEGALPNNLGSWWVWRTNIKDMYNNSTEGYLDALFQSIKN